MAVRAKLSEVQHLLTPEQVAEYSQTVRQAESVCAALANPKPDTARHEVGRVWTLAIDGWRPHLLNELIGKHPFVIHKRKKSDAEVIAFEAVRQSVPGACGKRLVELTIQGPWRRRPDCDSPQKSFLDAMVTAGLLVDDSDEWCDWTKPKFPRGELRTTVTLEEV